LLMDRNKMRGPSIDASYHVSLHLAEGFQRRRWKWKVNGWQTTSDGKSSHCLWPESTITFTNRSLDRTTLFTWLVDVSDDRWPTKYNTYLTFTHDLVIGSSKNWTWTCGFFPPLTWVASVGWSHTRLGHHG
jgi:hypothetical protein